MPFGLYFAFFELCISMNPEQNPSSRSRAKGQSAMRNPVVLHDGSSDDPSFDFRVLVKRGPLGRHVLEVGSSEEWEPTIRPGPATKCLSDRDPKPYKP